MRNSFTAVIEQSNTYTAGFATEPYETGWASEARWFVRVLEIEGTLAVRPQISPDGLVWCDEGSTALDIDAPGMWSFPLRDFGHWLRLDCPVTGRVKVLVYLALKE
jgi:hypothetical protein